MLYFIISLAGIALDGNGFLVNNTNVDGIPVSSTYACGKEKLRASSKCHEAHRTKKNRKSEMLAAQLSKNNIG